MKGKIPFFAPLWFFFKIPASHFFFTFWNPSWELAVMAEASTWLIGGWPFTFVSKFEWRNWVFSHSPTIWRHICSVFSVGFTYSIHRHIASQKLTLFDDRLMQNWSFYKIASDSLQGSFQKWNLNNSIFFVKYDSVELC